MRNIGCTGQHFVLSCVPDFGFQSRFFESLSSVSVVCFRVNNEIMGEKCCLSMSWRRIGGVNYSSTHSQPRCQMEVSGILTTLTPLNRRLGGPQSRCRSFGEEKTFTSAEMNRKLLNTRYTEVLYTSRDQTSGIWPVRIYAGTHSSSSYFLFLLSPTRW